MRLFIEQLTEQHGDRAAMVPVECLSDLRRDVDALKESAYSSDAIRIITRDFYDFTLPDRLPPIRSIVVMASPSRIVRLFFNWRQKRVPVTLPARSKGYARIEGYLSAALGERGYRVLEAGGLPLKMLAVRAGLSEYGRNNVAYTEGFGSFSSLFAFYTDAPCEDGYIWRDLCRMNRCEGCGVCIGACPTGAIDASRTVIRTERCLTYLNEFVDLCPFPSWLPPSAHNCLHGCLMCQTHCPANHGLCDQRIDAAEFTQDETRALLSGALPDALAEKLRKLELLDYAHLIPRNLKALLDQIDFGDQ